MVLLYYINVKITRFIQLFIDNARIIILYYYALMWIIAVKAIFYSCKGLHYTVQRI